MESNVRILNEKIIGTRGPWVFKARYVEYHTKDRGKHYRPEVVFEKMGHDETGFGLEDLQQIAVALQAFAEENYHRG
jgi:hypothetical protein